MSKGKLTNLSQEELRFFSESLDKYIAIQDEMLKRSNAIDQLISQIENEKRLLRELANTASELRTNESSMYTIVAKNNGMEVKDVKEAIFHIFAKTKGL